MRKIKNKKSIVALCVIVPIATAALAFVPKMVKEYKKKIHIDIVLREDHYDEIHEEQNRSGYPLHRLVPAYLFWHYTAFQSEHQPKRLRLSVWQRKLRQAMKSPRIWCKP